MRRTTQTRLVSLLAATALSGCGDTTTPEESGPVDTVEPNDEGSGDDDVVESNEDGAGQDGAGDDVGASDTAALDVGSEDVPGDGDTGDAAGPIALPDDLDMTAADFPCITTGTKVRGFFVWNLTGRLDETLSVANSETGGTYPVGTLIQFVPSEAIVKRKAGFSAETKDWEFFALDVGNDGSTTIVARGAADTKNQFGGNCAECHSKAAPQWDLLCEDTHGCDPLPLGDDLIQAIQDSDPRCPK